MTCNLRHPTSLRHPVVISPVKWWNKQRPTFWANSALTRSISASSSVTCVSIFSCTSTTQTQPTHPQKYTNMNTYPHTQTEEWEKVLTIEPRTPPKKILGNGFWTPYTLSCLICTIKLGLDISRTNTEFQRNPVYQAFHRIRHCGNETIRQ